MKRAKPETQAKTAAKHLTAHGVSRAITRHTPQSSSVGIDRNFKAAMRGLVKYVQGDDPRHPQGDIYTVTTSQVREYLKVRTGQISKEHVAREREQLNKWLEYRGRETIDSKETKDKGKDTARLAKIGRYYTQEQVQMISGHMADRNALATDIARAAGLRAHELLTIARPAEQPPHDRPWRPDKNIGQPDHKYTVIGKGGLIREIRLPSHLAERLEERRLDSPETIRDRDIFYQSRYDIGGGNAWSSSFTNASKRTLEWSTGAHSLRHAYAQERMEKLQQMGYSWKDAREIISQEVGHFRPSETDAYLR